MKSCLLLPRPEFFIIGAPKSGTTSIRKYLLSYPDVYIPSPEEPNFFCSDINPSAYGKGINWYLNRYYNIKPLNYNLIGEKSTWYLYSKEATKNILAFNLNAKLIVMIRNPIQLVYAFHQEMVYCRMETIHDFKTAWEIQEDRCYKNTMKNGDMKNLNLLFHYGQVASVGSQLERLLDQIPFSQLFIGFLDDLKNSPDYLLSNLCDFLGLPHYKADKSPSENKSKRIISPLLDYILVPPKSVQKSADKFKEVTGVKHLGIGKLMRTLRFKINTKNVKRQPLAEDFKKELVEFFEPEITKLEKLTGRDLSHYLSI